MRLAVLFLCHEAPEAVARRLSSVFYRNADVKVYLHYDAKRSAADLERLRTLLPATLQVHVLEDRVRGEWGEYSLVEATHRLMRQALSDTSFHADYCALISASCTPIRPFASLQEFLRRRRGIDFIQAHDIRRGAWVAGGLQEERFKYYFPVNFIKQRWLFDQLTAWQRRLGVERTRPEGLLIHFGSQWFCLTRETCSHVVAELDKPELRKFFADSWIPDEFAIQTLVATHRRPAFVAGHNLTYYEFDTQGLPLVLDNGHFDHLLKQPFFFARKVAPEGAQLMQEIEAYLGGTEYDLSYFDRIGQPTNDFHAFLAQARERKSVRSHIGSVKDVWRGPMDVSRRRYYVLYGASRRYLLRLLATARGMGQDLPIFDLLFEPGELQPARERGAYLGVQVSDRRRRDHDPCAFLHEVVHVDARRPTAFGIDAGAPVWARDFVLWDRNATLISCDPPQLGLAQRASAALRDLESVHDFQRVSDVVAGALKSGVLPQDHFQQARQRGEHSCQFAALHELPHHSGDATLDALRAASSMIDAGEFYLSAQAAHTEIFG